MTDEPADRWDGASAEELADAWGLPRVALFARVGSTNDVARGLAAAGAPAGTLVLAEEQLAGRGQRGRAWSSPPGLGLWMSVVLRPGRAADPALLPLRVGLAAARALDALVRPLRTRIKWPNDLYLGGRKTGGILCEGVWDGAAPGFVVAGLGINVLHSPGDFPETLRPTATSLRIAAGSAPSRREVAGAVAREIAPLLAPDASLPAGWTAELEERDLLRGREIVVLDPLTGGAGERGIALGIAPDGALLLRTMEGVIRPLRSGTVRLADP